MTLWLWLAIPTVFTLSGAVIYWSGRSIRHRLPRELSKLLAAEGFTRVVIHEATRSTQDIENGTLRYQFLYRDHQDKDCFGQCLVDTYRYDNGQPAFSWIDSPRSRRKIQRQYLSKEQLVADLLKIN